MLQNGIFINGIDEEIVIQPAFEKELLKWMDRVKATRRAATRDAQRQRQRQRQRQKQKEKKRVRS